MLVLSRKIHEAIIITIPDGRKITLRVIDMQRGKVRIGVGADADIVVNRQEVEERIAMERSDGQ